MNTAPWIDRLRTQCPGFRFVGGALDLNEAALQSVVFPAAFVIPVSEAGEPLDITGLHVRMVQTWAVAVVLKAMRTKAGVDQTAELEVLRTQVRAALQGWQASAQHVPAQFEAGQLEAIEGGSLIWIDHYTAPLIPH